MVVYDKPTPEGGDVQIRLTEKEAIEIQRKRYDEIYPGICILLDDTQLLEDFLTTNGAWIEGETSK